MPNLVKHRSKKTRFSALIPRRGFSALRYMVSRKKNQNPMRHDDALAAAFAPKDAEFKHISFTFAIISLSAKLAMTDGVLRRESYLVFREAFPLSGGLCPKLRKLFVLACDDPTPMEHYVQQIKHIFPRNQALFYALTARMFAIAAAHPPVSKPRERFLAKLAHMLEISPSVYSTLYEQYTAPKPHHIMGVGKKPTKQLLKKRYHHLMQRYHPDRYATETLSPEVAQLLSLRTTEISTAYKMLSKRAA